MRDAELNFFIPHLLFIGIRREDPALWFSCNWDDYECITIFTCQMWTSQLIIQFLNKYCLWEKLNELLVLTSGNDLIIN